MAVSSVLGPDGKTYTLEHPDGASQEDIFKFVHQSTQVKTKPEPTKPGVIGNVVRGIPAGAAAAGYDVLGAIGTMAYEGLGKYAKRGADPEYVEKIDQAVRGAQEKVAEYTFDIGATAGKAFGVDEGRFSADVGRGLGQLPLMVVTAGMASVPMSFAEVIKDAEQSLGVKYYEMPEEEKAKVAATGAAYAAFSLAADRIGLKYMGLSKLDKFFDGSETVKGSVVKDVLTGALGEGLTETSQAVVKDQLARVYDDDREYNLDSVKEYLYEGAVGATVGGIASTGTTTLKQFSGKPGTETTGTKKEDLKKPVKDRPALEIPRNIEVEYKELDGQVRIVPIAVGKDEDVIAVAEEALRGRYDEKYGITVTETTAPQPIEVVTPEVEPDVTTEEVPVQPEAAVEPVVEPVVEPTPEAIEDDAFPDLPEQSARTQLEFDPFADPEPEQAPVEAPVKRSFSLPQNLKKGKPGYRQTQGITFASDLERAAYSATTSTRSEPGKRKRESYRKILQDAGYSTTEINEMGREVRSQMRDQYDGPGSELSVALPQDVVAEAAPVPGPVSTEAAIGRIELEKLAPQANEDFFQFWARALDSTGTRFKASSKNYGRVAKNAVFDTLKFFKENPKFATYYETDTKLTRQYVESAVGPITDSEFNLFRILAGLTSPSTKLPDNIIDTLRVFKLYKDQGNFNFIVPSKSEKGARTYDKVKTGFLFRSTTGATKATSILAIQKKIDEVGLDATVKYLLEPVTMKELVASKRSLGYKDVGKKSEVKQVVKQATGQDTLIPRMFMFGPKVGAYAMNTLGNVEYTTTDIWESRFIRSYFSGMLESGTGLPENVDEQKIFQEFSSAFNKEFQKQTGEKLEPASLQAVRWFYILNAFNRIGYQYAKTDDTISGYTAKAAQELYGIDPTSGGQSTGADTSPVPAGNRLFGQPLQDSTSVSERYQRSKGIRGQEPRPVVELDEERAAVIGKAYDKMKHDPTNPEVVRAYDALVKETIDQYDAILEDGYAMELSEVEYNSSQDMIDDVRNRKVMRVFSTEDGFGTKGISAKERRENPMLAETSRTDKNGKPLLVNDIFRFVHDFFGHGKLGNGFGPIGEENAWNVHSLMFSPLARRALTTETRGQNSWVNFSGVNDKAFEVRDQARKARADGNIKEAKRLSKLAYGKMKFADQKIGLLPSEFSESTYQEEVTAEAAQPEVEDRGPQDTFANGGQVMDFVESTFDAVAEKVGVAIRPAMGVNYTARYNATQQVIEYNPMALLNRSKSGVKAAMREEIIHASMHQVLMQKATKGGKKVDPGKVWVNFFDEFAKTLTAQERVDIGDVYQSLTTYSALGAEYSRAVVQNLLYGEFSEQYVMQSKGGPAWNRIVDLLRSVQAYMAKVLGPMRKTNPEAAQVIVDSVELLKAADPDARPKNQQVVAEAYDAVDNNTAKENAEGDGAPKDASQRVREERKWWDGNIRSKLSKGLTPIITRLRRINPQFALLFQRLENKIRERNLTYKKQAQPFFNKLNSLNSEDFNELKQLLSFSPTPDEANLPENRATIQRRDALLHKNGLLNMYRLDVQPILEEIYAQYSELGMPIGYLEDYFPRVVKDLEGLIKSYGYETKRTFGNLVRDENARRKEKGLPEMESSERARFFQDFLQNKFSFGPKGVRPPGNVKLREIQTIPPSKLKFYEDPSIAFGSYTTSMVSAIEAYKVLGATNQKGNKGETGELGQLTEQLFQEGKIDEQDASELKSIAELATLQASQELVPLRELGSATYIATLIDVGTVLVQFLDLAKVLVLRGPSATVKGIYRTVTGNRTFDIERDFSILKKQIMAEFDQESGTQKVLNLGLRYIVPFQQMDVAMKHASVEAAFEDYLKKANSPVGSKKYQQLMTELTIRVGPEAAFKAVQGFRKDTFDPKSSEVKEALMMELFDRQPITYLQIPETHRRSPNARLLYKLKTFMLLDINFNRQLALNDLMGPGKTVEQRYKGLKMLVAMMAALTAIGVPKDLLLDFIRGKDTYLSDHVINNMLQVFGLSRYGVGTIFKDGPIDAITDRFEPAAISILDGTENDLLAWVKGDREISEFKVWNNAPLFDIWGRFTEDFQDKKKKKFRQKIKEGQRPTIRRN